MNGRSLPHKDPAVARSEGDALQDHLHRLEAQVAALTDANQALQGQKAAAESLLAQSAANLAMPMSLILGYQQVMDAHPGLHAQFERDAGARGMMDGLSSAVGRMQAVLTEMGMLARVLSGRLELRHERVRLAEVLARALSAFAEPMRQRQIALRLERVHFPNVIDADEPLLELLFRHLLSNAIHAMPDGGTLTLAAQVIPGAAPGGMVRFSIRDTGVGIAHHDLERIFSVYASAPGSDTDSISPTDSLGAGMGLGLVICKAIVEAHGGRLWAESPGHDPAGGPGSTFIVVLPVKEQREP